MNVWVGLFFDVVTLGVLGLTIFYALRLSQQFQQMQADRKAFEVLIQALNVASGRAEGAIRSLKEAAQESGHSLQEKVNTARGLSEELEIMVQAGDNLADRLSVLAEEGRKAYVETEDDTLEEVTVEPDAVLRTRAEQELLEAVNARNKV